MSTGWTRRNWLQAMVSGGAVLGLGRLAHAAEPLAGHPGEDRYLELFNTHTGETATVLYRRGVEYASTALDRLQNVLRDHRNGERHPIDVRLYDQLHALARSAGREARFEVISGYRSPESNARMSSRPGSGVAKRSLHMEGRAIDVRLKGCSCSALRDLALAARQGGVGYYQRSDFVHIDTGSFRTWAG